MKHPNVIVFYFINKIGKYANTITITSKKIKINIIYPYIYINNKYIRGKNTVNGSFKR